MKTISGLFDTYEQASQAVDALEDAGIPSETSVSSGLTAMRLAAVRRRGQESGRQLAASAGYLRALVLLPFQALDR